MFKSDKRLKFIMGSDTQLRKAISGDNEDFWQLSHSLLQGYTTDAKMKSAVEILCIHFNDTFGDKVILI